MFIWTTPEAFGGPLLDGKNDCLRLLPVELMGLHPSRSLPLLGDCDLFASKNEPFDDLSTL